MPADSAPVPILEQGVTNAVEVRVSPPDARPAGEWVADPGGLRRLAARTTGEGRVVVIGSAPEGAAGVILSGLSESASPPRFPLLRYTLGAGAAPAQDHANGQMLARRTSACAGVDALYPEREPIELLCTDASGGWGAHRWVLGQLGGWLRPGSVLVQHEFAEPSAPWAALLMWQLRAVFEPIDGFAQSASLAFRCIATPDPGLLDGLWEASDCADAPRRREMWDRVRAYWSVRAPRAADALYGHEASHAASAGDFTGAIDAAQRYDAWANSVSARGRYRSPAWRGDLEGMIAGAIASRDVPHETTTRARALAAELIVRTLQTRGAVAPHLERVQPIHVRRRVWSEALRELREHGHTRLALYGAGAHTRWLLGSGLLGGDQTVVCVLDDHPREAAIEGVPVVEPGEAGELLGGVSAILPSSDAHEAGILDRAHAHFPSSRYFIPKLYTSPARVESAMRHAADESVEPAEALARVAADDVPAIAPERAALGLPMDRSWTSRFADTYASPSWSSGYVNHRDTLLLWDVIEAVRPRRVVEVGTASGVSAASIAAALELFCSELDEPGEPASVHTFDISAHCYFDQTRDVGSAVGEVAPDLLQRVEIHPRSTAFDACRRHVPGQIDLAFIDGDHRHPAPTFDLLALIDALRPGAWVVLHDIEMTALGNSIDRPDWSCVTGAERLFKRWPFDKVQPGYPDAALNNIGAIRMPENRWDAVVFLLGLVVEPWETRHGPPRELEDAVARVNPSNTSARA